MHRIGNYAEDIIVISMFIYRSVQGIVVILVLGVCKYHWVRIYDAYNIKCNQTAKCNDSK